MGLSGGAFSAFGGKSKSNGSDGMQGFSPFSASRIRYYQVKKAQESFYNNYNKQLFSYVEQYKLQQQAQKQAEQMKMGPAGVGEAFGGMPNLTQVQPPVWNWDQYGKDMEEANKLPWFAQPD
jgi:hypothetical protein